jgi:hypothetical protein
MVLITPVKYDKQDQQGKAAFNGRNPHMTKQQEPLQQDQATRNLVEIPTVV